jgi:acyl carrier protein
MPGGQCGPDVENIRTSIVAFLAEELKQSPEVILRAGNLRELPGAESVKILRVVARIERQFGIELDDEIVFRIESLDELVRAVSQLSSEDATR